MLKNLLFWRKFIRYLLVGFSALIILAGFNYVGGFQRGPLPASAQELGFISSGESDLPLDGFPIGFISTGEQPLPTTQTQTSCTETPRDYPQCGNTAGLENFPATDTIMVREWTNNCTGAKRWEVVASYGNLGQCAQAPQGVPQPQPEPQPQPQPQPQAQPSQYQDYSACGQSGQLWVGGGYRALQGSDCTGNTYLKIYRDQSGYITTFCEAVPPGNDRNNDGCGYHAATTTAAPVSTCGRQEVNEGCVDNSFRSFRTIDTCSGFSSARRVWDPVCASTTFDGCQEFVTASFCSSQSFRTDRVRNTCDGMGEFTRTVWDSNCGFFSGSPGFFGCTTTILSNRCISNGVREQIIDNSCSGRTSNTFADSSCGFISTSQPIVQPVVQQPVVQQPVVQPIVQPVVQLATAEGVCPAGYTKKVEGGVINCIATAPSVTVQPTVVRVAGVEAKELPKTGLPLLAWAAAAFIPAGFKMRNLGRVKKAAETAPTFIWEDRQFKI